MPEKHWIDYLAAIGSVATPVIVLVITALGWKFRRIFERQFELEDKLRENRLKTYNSILAPFIILFTSEEVWQNDDKNKDKDKDKNEVALRKLLSINY